MIDLSLLIQGCPHAKIHLLMSEFNFSSSLKMSMIKTKQIEALASDIWRVFVSGSSSAGKTYFAKQLLNSGLIKYDRIHYFHPDIL